MNFFYREANKRWLKRLFLQGKGRYLGKPLYTAAVGAELALHRLADTVLPAGERDAAFVNENLTAVIKTFERPKIVRRLVRSIRRFYPDLPVIVVDDSREPTRIEGVKTIVMPYDSGVSAGRNAGVLAVKTPYLLMLDDDYVFYRKTGLLQAMEIMHAESDIDILGGARIDLPFYRIVDHSQSVLFPTLRTSVLPVGSTVGGLPVYDKVAQFFIARTERIRQVMWDEELKRIDHADFFTRAKGRLVTAYFAGLRCLHAQSRFDENYLSKRSDTGDYGYLRKKYYRDRDSAT